MSQVESDGGHKGTERALGQVPRRCTTEKLLLTLRWSVATSQERRVILRQERLRSAQIERWHAALLRGELGARWERECVASLRTNRAQAEQLAAGVKRVASRLDRMRETQASAYAAVTSVLDQLG